MAQGAIEEEGVGQTGQALEYLPGQRRGNPLFDESRRCCACRLLDRGDHIFDDIATGRLAASKPNGTRRKSGAKKTRGGARKKSVASKSAKKR